MSFFGRYVRVDFPELGRSFESSYDERREDQPRIVIDAQLERSAYTQGSISIYNLSESSVKSLQDAREYSVDVFAGWSSGGRGQIVRARKSYLEIIRIGTDVITKIYFVSAGMKKKEPKSYSAATITSVITDQAETFGYSVSFDDAGLAGKSVSNISLRGNIYERMSKLASIHSFEYYEQSGSIIVSTGTGVGAASKGTIDLDSSDGILSIPSYTDFGVKINFTMMFNPSVRIGKLFRVTNKYARIAMSDTDKSFSSDALENSLRGIENVQFRTFDIRYSLDTRGEAFNMDIEGQRLGGLA